MTTLEANHRAAIHQVERQVLHTAMCRPSSIADMQLQPGHFGNEAHGQLWELIRSMDAGGKPVDAVTMSDVPGLTTMTIESSPRIPTLRPIGTT